MAKHSLITWLFGLFILYSISNGSSAAAGVASYNVIKYGAKPDGKTDATASFLQTWAAACGSIQAATIYVPKGRYLIKTATFRGPCKNKIDFKIDGTLVAPLDYTAVGNSGYWILFIQVNGLSVIGGKLDAKASGFWACRQSGKNCPAGARSITFNWINDGLFDGIMSLNSQIMHITINSCNNIIVRNVVVIASYLSPNTDGIHVQGSTSVSITNCNIRTGDDCISIGPNTRNLWMEKIRCGPGHGISIGSLGRDYIEDGVENVTLANSIFTGSDNGLRIKTWGRPSTSFVRNVNFRNIIMKNVENPIIIDQNYCPDKLGCPNQVIMKI
ncbi:hypothetical protein M9H77_16352 [Catharanthus roseus]|uniref:Uncharacterized protein n=1 Tax=Catharanthus roseus TaxID=4058 RepID=A0ACC0B1I7_CATRO|nr:hypothetical protein M9H77_16352 [Catharanthus roseus]